MAILAGKFIYDAAFQLQSRAFVNPWSRKILVRCCSNSGEISTDFPVRYIPKRSSNSSKISNSTPPPKDSENYQVRRFTNPNSSSVEFPKAGESSRRGFFLDEKSPNNDLESGNLRSEEKNIHSVGKRLEEEGYDHEWKSADSKLMEELHDFDVMEGPEDVLDELGPLNGKHKIKHLTLEPTKTKVEAEKTAIGLLASRAHTAVELKKKLLAKKYSHEIVNAVISDFQSRGLINDFIYAEAFSRSRWSSSTWGPRRIKQALVKKGVNDLDAVKAIKLVLEDGEPSVDQVSTLGLSKASMDHLFAQASKQWLRGKDVPSEKRKSRIMTWLQYRGFNWGVIKFILKKLQSEYPP